MYSLIIDLVFFVTKNIENHSKSQLEKTIRSNGGKVTTSMKADPYIICTKDSVDEIKDVSFYCNIYQKVDLDDADVQKRLISEDFIDEMVEKKGKAKIDDYVVDISSKPKATKRKAAAYTPKAKKDKKDTTAATASPTTTASSTSTATTAKKGKKGAKASTKKSAVDVVMPDKIAKGKEKKFPTIHVDKVAQQYFAGGEVYKDNDCVWHATLNQTNLKGNNNKFYICQLIKCRNIYHCFFRWGRVGYEGQTSRSVFYI